MDAFQLQQSSLEVCKTILKNHEAISSVTCIAHTVSENWRQINRTAEQKLNDLISGLQHPTPIRKKLFTRKEFLELEKLEELPDDEVWSMTSKISYADGTYGHIPMMNFHPESISFDQLKNAIEKICGDRRGVLLESGRYFHYYGDYLLSEEEWLRFMADFLMPCVLVSPRYIGHRLYDGYCTLRLTTGVNHKTQFPRVISVL